MHLIDPYDGAPDKQRLIDAMRGERTDRVPNFEVLIEDRHVERLLGRKAGNTLGVGGDPAKGSEAAEGVRPMYPNDYLQLCRIIGQDAIVLENLWMPIRQRKPDGTVVTWNDRSFKGPADLERIVEPARAAHKPILFHSDGKIDDAVEMLLDMGVDCLNPMDPSGVDYRDYKRRYGHRVSLSGNIDITWPLVKGTPDDVERDVKEHMDVLKPGGRWIAGSSHSNSKLYPARELRGHDQRHSQVWQVLTI